MYVHAPLLVALARCKVEVPCHLVDLYVTVHTASLALLFANRLHVRVVFTLVDVIYTAECPPAPPVRRTNLHRTHVCKYGSGTGPKTHRKHTVSSRLLLDCIFSSVCVCVSLACCT